MTAWARQLRRAGLDGDMDQLRARAFIDLLLGTDSRPLGSGPDGADSRDGDGRTGEGGVGEIGSDRSGGPSGPGEAGPGPRGPRDPVASGPADGVIPPGFADRGNLTIPLATLLGLADRPGEMAGIGPIDPNPGANTPIVAGS